MKYVKQAAVAAFLSAAAMSPAAATVIGVADSSNGMPFGASYLGSSYQQVYSASSLGSSPVNINSISFYQTVTPGGTPLSGTFNIYLTYVPSNTNINTFDSSGFIYNYGQNVFTGAVGTVNNGRLDFTLSNAFNYDPSQGLLMMTITNNSTDYDNRFFLDTDKNNGLTNSHFSSYQYDWGQGQTPYFTSQGLVTGFNEAVAPVPEPSTWAMMILGFFGVGFVAYRRRRGTVALAA